MKEVKHAISVARKVLEETDHTLLVGDDATRFAEFFDFPIENLTTAGSSQRWENWVLNGKFLSLAWRAISTQYFEECIIGVHSVCLFSIMTFVFISCLFFD